nr:uncharacterized protein LOC101037121 isoform X2 [Saimiri boliviensis boliviensis]
MHLGKLLSQFLQGQGDPCLVLGHGFLGLTRPGGKFREGHLASSWSLSLNSTYLGDLLPPEPGIRNPTVCLRANDALAFLVTHEHYPEYDLGHFYNTLEQFDWGYFRALAEESQLYEQSLSLFPQQFQQTGVYVFRLSSNRHRKMYLRALPPGGQCFGEGPFASTAPRYLIQTGIARIPRPLKGSGWPGLLGEMVLLLGLCLLLMIQCHSLSWARKTAPHPTFRRHQQEYNLDGYTSPRTGIMSMRRGRSHQDSDAPRVEGGPDGSWEAKEQVDLEWFNTEAFFGILLRQSLSVTAKLSQTKEELKLLYLKLLREAHSLQQLWGARRCLPASTSRLLGSMQREQQQATEAAARAAEEEARRRGHLAGEYAASLRHQLKLLRQDLHERQEQWASFCSALMEAQQLLKAWTGSRPEKSSPAGQNSERAVPQLDTVLGHLSQVMLREGHRLKAWGILSTGTGAELLRPGMMRYPGTELWVPALYGMEIPDPEGSGLMVPILGMEHDENLGEATPLAGSMEDAHGKGLIPISIGAQAIDPLTGEPGPVIGAQRDPSSRVVVPIVQVLESLPRGVRDPGLLDTLEQELRAREQYWHHQEQEEKLLLDHLGHLSQELHFTAGNGVEQQMIASGTPVCLENYPGHIFYGTVTASVRDLTAACPMLIPFLKQLATALVGAQGLEDQRPGTVSLG